MTIAEGRLLGDEESFARLGLDPVVRAPWEDGLRLKKPFKSGEWEWWYCDAHLDDGYFCVTSFHLEVDAPEVALQREGEISARATRAADGDMARPVLLVSPWTRKKEAQ